MSTHARTLILAAVSAAVLVIAISVEAWAAIPVVSAIAVLLLARGRRVGGSTAAAGVGLVGSAALIVFGSIATLLSMSGSRVPCGSDPCAMGPNVFLIAGVAAIVIGIVGLAVSARSLSRALRQPPAATL